MCLTAGPRRGLYLSRSPIRLVVGRMYANLAGRPDRGRRQHPHARDRKALRMTQDRRILIYLVEKFGGVDAALDAACKLLVDIMPATSMGMLRCGRRGRPIDSEYGGQSVQADDARGSRT